MKCTKCRYWDAVPGTKVCQQCARQPVQMPTRRQQQVAALQDTINMLMRERERDKARIDEYADLLREVIQERDTLYDELNALKLQMAEGGAK